MTLRSVWELFRRSYEGWNEIDAPRLGAALAYYTVLSLAPLLVVAVAVAGVAFGPKAAEGEIVWQFGDTIGHQGAQVVQTLLQSAQQPAAGITATVLGFIVLLFGASGVFGELRDSLNDVWGVRKQVGGGLLKTIKYRFYSFAMVLGIGFLLLVSLLLSAFLSAAGKFFDQILPMPESVLQVLNSVFSLIVVTVLFALIYKVVPDVRIAWSDVWAGAAMTSILFTLGKFLIGLYLGKAGVGSPYGAAGSVVVVLVWVYYSAQILLFGAEITRHYSEMRGSRATRTRSPHRPVVESIRRPRPA